MAATFEQAPPETAVPAERPPLDRRLTGHLPALDGIRGLAVLAVTLYRFGRLGPTFDGAAGRWLERAIAFGENGVDLFFVLSGFLITGLLFDARGGERYFKNFYIRRTLRIFPLYYGTLAAAMMVWWFWPGWSGAGKAFAQTNSAWPWLWCYATNVQQSLANAWTGGIFTHTWSLAVEEHFYLLWPLVIFLCDRRQAIRACWFLILAAPALRLALLAVWPGKADLAVSVFTLCRMDALAMGALLALLARGPDGLDRLRSWMKFTAVVALAVGALPVALEKRLFTIGLSAGPAFYTAVLYLAIVSRKGGAWQKFFSHPGLRFLGKYSYAMYLFQVPLLAIGLWYVQPETLIDACGSILGGRLAFTALLTAATALTAWLSWHLFEKHFLALKDRWAPSAPRRSVSSAAQREHG